jgi:polysaccharide biosynthesis protein PslJ
MTAVAERPAPPAPGRVTADGRPAGRRIDAVTILTVWLILLMGIPATLVVAPFGAVGGPATIFAAVVFVVYLVTWLHPALAPARGRQPVRAAAILLTCAVIATYVSANRHIMPGLERNGIDRGIILICGWLAVLVMASDGILSIERLKKLLGRVVIGATTMATLGITQFFTGLDATHYIVIPGLQAQAFNTDLLSRNGLNRPSATAAHPLEFAVVLAMALPIAINRARFAPPGARLRRWIQVGLIGVALPMTVSRSAVLAVLAVAFVLLPTWPKLERRIAYGVMALGVAGIWMLVPGLAGTFRDLFATLSGDTSTTSRTSAFSNAMPYLSQHPWFGHGFGTFFPASYFFTDDQYLLSLIEIGAVGLFALLALFVTGLVTAQRVRRATKDPEMRDLGQSLTATIAVAMVAFGTFDALSFNMAAGLTFMFLGCTGAALRLLKAQGAQADGHLADQPVMPPDQELPVLTHRPRQDGPDGPGAMGATRALGGLAGLHAGQEPNGHPSAPDERQASEQANGHLPGLAEQQLEQPAGPRQEEEAGAQVEKLIDRYLGESAHGHPAGPAEAGHEESVDAQVQQSAKSPWEGQLWPWEPQDLQPSETRQEEKAAETRQEEKAAETRQEEKAAETRQEQPEAPARRQPAQAEGPELLAGPPRAQAEQPAEVQAEQPAARTGQPADVQAERPAEPPWDPWRKAMRPVTQPTAAAAYEQAAEPIGQQTAEPAEGQAGQAAEAPWDARRRAGQPADQQAAEPIGQAAAEAPGRHEPEPVDQPTPEPADERPEESTMPIPIIRD